MWPPFDMPPEEMRRRFWLDAKTSVIAFGGLIIGLGAGMFIITPLAKNPKHADAVMDFTFYAMPAFFIVGAALIHLGKHLTKSDEPYDPKPPAPPRNW